MMLCTGNFAFGRVGGENVVLNLIALQVGGDVLLDLLVIRAAQRARAEFHYVFHILHGAIAVECRRRAAVGRERERRGRWCPWAAGVGNRCGGVWPWRGFFVTVTRQHR